MDRMQRRTCNAVLICALSAAACREDAQTALARGNILRNQGRLADAAEAYRDAEVRAPGNAAMPLALGDVLSDLSRPDEALAAYRRAAAADPKSPVPRIAAARVLGSRGDLAAARSELTAAIALDPRANHARLSRGHLALKGGDAAAAVADFTEAAHLEGRNPVVLYSLVRGLVAVRDLSGAETTAARLEQVAPGSALSWYARALVASARGDRAAAIPALKAALAAAPGEAEAALSDPVLASLKGDPEVAGLIGRKP